MLYGLLMGPANKQIFLDFVFTLVHSCQCNSGLNNGQLQVGNGIMLLFALTKKIE